jgi:hypothetical protein
MHFRRIVLLSCIAPFFLWASAAMAGTSYFGGAVISGTEGTWLRCSGGRNPVCTTEWQTGDVILTVNGSSVSTTYGGGSTAGSIASALCSQMTSSFPAQCTSTNGTGTTYFVNAQAKANYSVSASVTKSNPDQIGIPFTATAPAGKADPKYYILSLLYAPPGNKSSNGYTNSTTYGTTTTITKSFMASDTTTFSVSGGLFGSGGTFGWSFGFASMTGSSDAFGWSVSEGQGVTLDSAGPSNAINHAQDTFVIWLNPEITFEPTGPTATNYGLGTPPQTTGDPDPGAPQSMDTVTVSVAELQNPSLIPASVLGPQHLPDGEILPGLSNICANPNACVASDFTAIVNSDPLVNFSPTQNPTSVNGANNTRFVEIYTAEPLSGPPYQGANPIANTWTASDTNQTTQTWTGGYSYSEGFSNGGSLSFLGFGGVTATNTNTFTWSYSESVGDMNSQMHQMGITLESSTVACSEDVAVFEDTVFHTFAFQQPTGNTSCP